MQTPPESLPPEVVRQGTVRRRARSLGGFAMAAAALAVAWLLYRRWSAAGFDWAVFAASFRNIHWGWIAAAGALALATYWGRALRWAVMLRPMRPSPGLWNIFAATAIGFTAVVLLGRPGEFVRPYLIANKERVSFSSQLAVWFVERVLDLLAVLAIFGVALTRVRQSHARVGPALGWVLEVGGVMSAVLAAICLVMLALIALHADTMKSRLVGALTFLPHALYEKAERLADAFVEGTSATQHHASVLLLMLYTGLEWLLIALCYAAIFRAFAVSASFGFADVVTFMAFVAFGSVVQIPGIGGGMQIVSILVLRELFGLPLETATSMALLIWIVTFVVIVPPGLVLALREGLNWKKIKELKAEAAI